jgi:hypothetical protein
MTRPDTPVDENVKFAGAEESEYDWLDEQDELPRRPRRKLLSPVPVTLFVTLLLIGAFFAGVEVQKGQGSSSAAGGGLASTFAALRAARAGSSGATGTSGATGGSGASRGFAPGGLGGGGGAMTGEVSYVSGSTLYVVSGESTVKVHAPDGTKVSKTVSANVHGIHPGDTVVVRGSKGTNGSVTASSINIGSAGSALGLFGAGLGSGGSPSSSGSGGSNGGGATPQLFGPG